MEEEGQRTDRGSKHPLRINSPSAIAPVPSHSPIFNSFSHLYDFMGNKEEGKNLQITSENAFKDLFQTVKCFSKETDRRILRYSIHNLRHFLRIYTSWLKDCGDSHHSNVGQSRCGTL